MVSSITLILKKKTDILSTSRLTHSHGHRNICYCLRPFSTMQSHNALLVIGIPSTSRHNMATTCDSSHLECNKHGQKSEIITVS